MANTGMPGHLSAIDDVNTRIDKCVKDNSAPERLLWVILTLMVFVGLFTLVYGVLHDNHYLIGASLGTTGLTSWPTLRLIQLYRRKIALAVIPGITALLSPADAAREIHSLIKALLDKS